MPAVPQKTTVPQKTIQSRWGKLAWRLGILVPVVLMLMLTYTSSLIGVQSETVEKYESLRQTLIQRGHRPSLFVLSGKRYWLDNTILSTFGGASSRSRHLHGDAIDVVVLDVNDDGSIDRNDVDIVYKILDETLIGQQGGLGTYTNERNFFSRQMVHFDLRGRGARWHR